MTTMQLLVSSRQCDDGVTVSSRLENKSARSNTHILYTKPEVGDEFKFPFSELNTQHPVSH